MLKLYKIECCTGCTCCSSDNHYRGFYKTKEDAQKRIDYFKSPDSKYWPVASQYARRGHYSICEVSIEELPDGRFILNDDKVTKHLNIIEVKENGEVEDNDNEYLENSY
jgi:hypothetical protein